MMKNFSRISRECAHHYILDARSYICVISPVSIINSQSSPLLFHHQVLLLVEMSRGLVMRLRSKRLIPISSLDGGEP